MSPSEQKTDKLRVSVIGLGAIGKRCAQTILASPRLWLHGLADTDPAMVGATASDVLGVDRFRNEPKVSDDAAQAAQGADVAIVATGSRLPHVVETIEAALSAGAAVISSCEQLVWPRYRFGDLADRIDQAAKSAGKAVFGVGVNPGFVMDAMAIALATAARRVDRVVCLRRVDLSVRRPQLQAKSGVALSPDQFEQEAGRGEVGHKGLAESVALLAAGLGAEAQAGSIREIIEPVITEAAVPSAMGLVSPGMASGLHQHADWVAPDGRLRIELDLRMAIGQDKPKDLIQIEGPVPLTLKIPGAMPGDSATVAVILNHLESVANAPAGLLTRLDLPMPGCRTRA